MVDLGWESLKHSWNWNKARIAGESKAQVEAGATLGSTVWKGLGISVRAMEKYMICSEFCS